jgi:hypothetical protein
MSGVVHRCNRPPLRALVSLSFHNTQPMAWILFFQYMVMVTFVIQEMTDYAAGSLDRSKYISSKVIVLSPNQIKVASTARAL